MSLIRIYWVSETMKSFAPTGPTPLSGRRDPINPPQLQESAEVGTNLFVTSDVATLRQNSGYPVESQRYEKEAPPHSVDAHSRRVAWNQVHPWSIPLQSKKPPGTGNREIGRKV